MQIRLLIMLHAGGQANMVSHCFNIYRFDPLGRYHEVGEDCDAVVWNATSERQQQLPHADYRFEQHIYQLHYREKQ